VSRIAFCTAPDGVSLAYSAHGSGPPLVRAANWLTHIEFDWESPVWRHWLRALGERNTFLRYDERGCGLSDRDIPENGLSHEIWLADLETVVDAAGLDRFALLGVSQGASLAINYAVHHPDRVTHLVLYGGYVRGRLYRGEEAAEQSQMFHSVIKTGWGQENSAFRRNTRGFMYVVGDSQLVDVGEYVWLKARCACRLPSPGTSACSRSQCTVGMKYAPQSP